MSELEPPASEPASEPVDEAPPRLPLRDLAVIVLVIATLGGLTIWRGAPKQAQTGQRPPSITQVKTWLNLPPGEHPDWEAERRVDFARLAGQVVVIDFWSSWCPECRAANHHLNQLSERHAEGLVVLGVTMEDPFVTEAEILAYIENSVRFPVAFLAAGDTIAAYDVTTIPHAVIVGRDGMIKWMGKPQGEAFAEALELELKRRS